MTDSANGFSLYSNPTVPLAANNEGIHKYSEEVWPCRNHCKYPRLILASEIALCIAVLTWPLRTSRMCACLVCSVCTYIPTVYTVQHIYNIYSTYCIYSIYFIYMLCRVLSVVNQPRSPSLTPPPPHRSSYVTFVL